MGSNRKLPTSPNIRSACIAVSKGAWRELTDDVEEAKGDGEEAPLHPEGFGAEGGSHGEHYRNDEKPH